MCCLSLTSLSFGFGLGFGSFSQRVQTPIEKNFSLCYFKLFKIVSDRSSWFIKTLCKIDSFKNKAVFITQIGPSLEYSCLN